jgi:hypothetical protein
VNKRYIAELSINGHTIGEAKFAMDCTNNAGRILWLYVDPKERHKGYSTLLCALAGKKLLDLGCKTINGNLIIRPLSYNEKMNVKMGAQFDDNGLYPMKADNEQKSREIIYRITENFINRATVITKAKL